MDMQNDFVNINGGIGRICRKNEELTDLYPSKKHKKGRGFFTGNDV